MRDNEEIVRNLTSHYTYKVEKAFENTDAASKALEVIAKSLKEIYRYFEPSFFKGDFFVCKNFLDEDCFEESTYTLLYDKNILLNKTTGSVFIQVYNDNGKMLLSENQDVETLLKQKDTLIYHFKANKEYFFANENKIDITIFNEGSRYATQFNDLIEALSHYEHTKIKRSTCSHFSQSWSDSDSNRLFFKGGGRGNNVPEKFMQLSLHEFLSSYFIRGISMESSREYNIVGDYSKPKPVDIRINWREANRTAIIEVKFMGTVKKESDGEVYHLSNPRANYGITQLKGYHDTISSDLPTTIIKSYLVVIDGRRNNLTVSQTEINGTDGLHFKNVDIIIDEDKKFYQSIQGFEKPIRMFAGTNLYLIMINKDFSLNNTGVSNADHTRDLPRHRWYFYKEGFSPALVKKAIEENKLEKNDIVLDPFNGSGTVTLTAATEGINSIGFEVNPFTSFLSETKAHNLSKKTFIKESDKALLNCLRGHDSFLDNYSTFSDNGKNDKFLFNKEVIQSFSGGQNSLKGSGAKSANLIRLAMISAAMNNSNARKDGKCLRYKNDWQSLLYNKESFINSFEEEIDIISQDLDFDVKTAPKIKNGDSRILIDKMNDKFKLCITSPPYLNTFDYTDIYRPELFLGNFINSSDELRLLRHKTVRSHIQVNWKDPLFADFGPIFSEVYNKILSKQDLLMHKRIPEMIVAYFEDMKSIFASLKSKADKNASLWMVVSTSAYANEHIPVDLILAHIATQTGWKLKEIGVLREITKRKTKYSPDIDKLRESVIILTT